MAKKSLNKDPLGSTAIAYRLVLTVDPCSIDCVLAAAMAAAEAAPPPSFSLPGDLTDLLLPGIQEIILEQIVRNSCRYLPLPASLWWPPAHCTPSETTQV